MTYISGLEDLVELKKQFPGFEMMVRLRLGRLAALAPLVGIYNPLW